MQPPNGIPKHAKAVFTGTIHTVWQWDQTLYDGSTGVFEAISRPDYSTVVGVLPDKKVLLAWDEQPHRNAVLTTPGGRMEPGENPDEAAKREFEEETGYEIGNLVPFFSYMPGGKTKYHIHMYVGKDLKMVGEPTLDPGEKVELAIFSFDDFIRLGHDNSNDIGGPLRDWKLRTILIEAQLNPAKRAELETLFYG